MKDRSDSEDESSSPTQSPEITLFSQEKVKKIWWIIVSSSVISPTQAPMTYFYSHLYQAYFFNFLFAFLAGLLGILGPWFGPVSIFSPVKQIAQILCSVVTFSYVLKTEEIPSKEVSVNRMPIMIFSSLII